MNPLQQKINELDTKLEALQSSSTIPRNTETALRERLYIPNIKTGSGAPVTTPIKVADVYIDITNSKIYYAVATSSSSSWILLYSFTKQSAITAPTGGATVDSQARTAIGTIITTLQTLGLTS